MSPIGELTETYSCGYMYGVFSVVSIFFVLFRFFSCSLGEMAEIEGP